MYTKNDETIRAKICGNCGLTYNTLQECEIILDCQDWHIEYPARESPEYKGKIVSIKHRLDISDEINA